MPRCGKVCHATLLIALQHRADLAHRRRLRLYAYRCRRCRAWHLTRTPRPMRLAFGHA